MRSGNPVLKSDTFDIAPVGARMTLGGTVNKTAILLALLLITAGATWGRFYDNAGNPAAIMPLVWGGCIGGFIVALVTIFKKEWAGITAPIYALLEGLVVGGLSAIFEAAYPGIVIQAAGLTIAVLASLLLAYKSGLIKATENFKLGIVAATGGIALLYLANIVMSLFGHPIGFIHESGPLGIAFSGVVVVIAALNLVLDFDFIEAGVEKGAPKYMVWYGAFGLTVTLIWLYLEILRLLAKLRSR
jgi:uncharacterized YccA/Bax inhibitor family protein